MNSNQDNLENKLFFMLNELNKYHNSKEELYIKYITERLDKSLISYKKELDKIYLDSKNSLCRLYKYLSD